MKRSFRVATVFTGAACATALVPTAVAAAAPVAPAPMARITPDIITIRNCPSVPTNALHLYYTSSEYHYRGACVTGAVGSFIGFSGKKFSEYCAGEYSGNLRINGKSEHFTAGTHHLYKQVVSGVYLSKANHPGDTCSPSLIFI